MRGVFGLVAVGLGHGLLELDGGAQRIDGAGELDQRTVAGQLDQPAAVAGQHRLKALGAMGLQPRQRAVLVASHQARVADDIRRQDRRQSPYNPLAGHEASPRPQPAALRLRGPARLHLRYGRGGVVPVGGPWIYGVFRDRASRP